VVLLWCWIRMVGAKGVSQILEVKFRSQACERAIHTNPNPHRHQLASRTIDLYIQYLPTDHSRSEDAGSSNQGETMTAYNVTAFPVASGLPRAKRHDRSTGYVYPYPKTWGYAKSTTVQKLAFSMSSKSLPHSSGCPGKATSSYPLNIGRSFPLGCSVNDAIAASGHFRIASNVRSR
jgi:hypothetical protein